MRIHIAMKRQWTDEELEAHFTFHPAELDLVGDSKIDHNLLGFAVLLKYFQYEGRFLSQKQAVPAALTLHLAHQVGIDLDPFEKIFRNFRAQQFKGSGFMQTEEHDERFFPTGHHSKDRVAFQRFARRCYSHLAL